MSVSSWKEPRLISYVSIRTDFMLLSLLDGALSRIRGTNMACSRTGTRAGVIRSALEPADGTGWKRFPVRWISARRAGIASPQAYVFHRSSRRAGLGLRSLVLEEMGSKTDGWSFPSCYLPGDRR